MKKMEERRAHAVHRKDKSMTIISGVEGKPEETNQKKHRRPEEKWLRKRKSE